MKFKPVFSILIVLIISTFSYAIYLSFKLERTNAALSESIQELEEAKSKYIVLETSARNQLEKCLDDGTRNSWEIASATNTLVAYSSFIDTCNEEVTNCHKDELEKAINSLLNANGYVQMVETNGNPLFNTIKLSLEGKFIRFKTDKSIRNGAIGIPDCGSTNLGKTGIVLESKIVKVLNECYANGSKSVWGHIQYTN